MSLDLIDTAYNGSYFTISLANNQSKKVQLQKKQQPYFESKVKSPHYRMLIMMSTIKCKSGKQPGSYFKLTLFRSDIILLFCIYYYYTAPYPHEKEQITFSLTIK